MSAHGGPNIIEDGLVLSFDAANIKSFRGDPTTNLARNSRDFSGTAYASLDEWTSTEPTRLTKTYISSLVTPIGNGATLIQESGNTGYHHLSRYGGSDENGLHSLSCYIYPLGNDITDFCIGMLADATNHIRFNLVTVEITYGGGISNRNAFITPVDNYPGWYRVGANIEGRAGGWVGCFGYSSYTSYTGTNGAKKCYITGIQYEEKSYPTFFTEAQTTRGTTVATGGGWADRSGKSNNGELLNGPTYNSSNLGSLSFDGSNDYISIPYSATMDFSLAQTIIMWMKPGTGSNSTRRNPYNQAYGGSGTITHEPGANFNYYFGTHGGNNTPYVGIGSSFTVNPNELAFIAVTRSQPLNICRWYKNGARTVNTNAGGYAATNNGSSPIWLANGYTTYFIGDIYYVFVYNRFFTDEEILQTYNATKGRFGL
jgi:hypothetical protein